MSDYSGAVDWFLNSSQAAMGHSSSFSSFLASMERGSVAAGGVPNTDLYNERQIGWGPDNVIGDVKRERELAAAWHRLPKIVQVLLMARYLEVPKRFFDDNIAARIHGEWDSNQVRLSGLLVFWAWRRGELGKIEHWYSKSEPAYPKHQTPETLKEYLGKMAAFQEQKRLRAIESPRYRRLANRLSRLAHWHWLRVFRETSPGAQRVREAGLGL